MAARKGNFLKIGGKFGIYDVVRELGRGGMGAVYLVRDPASGDELAAKVMYPESATANDHLVRRFIREAEVAMKVLHPNLVRVFDVGRDPDTGLAYMLMEYVSGGSLKQRLKQRMEQGVGPYAVQDALSIVRQVADALGAVAAHGIVHRDVKPDNIIFDAAGNARLTDLGVAKGDAESDVTTASLTMSSVMLGTPAYMAPEQMTSPHDVDSRADIYSLGIVLWELLVGERPTAGVSASEMMVRVVRGDRIPDIRTRCKNVPAGVRKLIRRMTEPDPSRRFASPGDVISFIDKCGEWERKRLRVWLTGSLSVGVFLVLATLGVGIWYVATLKPSRKTLDLDVKISSATAPTITELAARAERHKEDVKPAVPTTNKKEPQPASAPQIAAPQVAVPQKTSEPKPAPAPKTATPPPPAPPPPAPPPAAQSQSVAVPQDKNSLEALMVMYREFAEDVSGVGRRQIAAAVNEARRFDPDFTAYSAEGRSLRGQRDLSAEDAIVYRKGMVFLAIELFRRQNGKMPSIAEVRKLLCRD